jgi:hypothetical protein
MAVFWVVAPCSLVEVYQAIALMMEAARNSEMSVTFYQTTRCYNPEDSHLNAFYVYLIHRSQMWRSLNTVLGNEKQIKIAFAKKSGPG